MPNQNVASANPENTRQWAGHLAHKQLLREQKEAQMSRRKARLRKKREGKA